MDALSRHDVCTIVSTSKDDLGFLALPPCCLTGALFPLQPLWLRVLLKRYGTDSIFTYMDILYDHELPAVPAAMATLAQNNAFSFQPVCTVTLAMVKLSLSLTSYPCDVKQCSDMPEFTMTITRKLVRLCIKQYACNYLAKDGLLPALALSIQAGRLSSTQS